MPRTARRAGAAPPQPARLAMMATSCKASVAETRLQNRVTRVGRWTTVTRSASARSTISTSPASLALTMGVRAPPRIQHAVHAHQVSKIRYGPQIIFFLFARALRFNFLSHTDAVQNYFIHQFFIKKCLLPDKV